MKFLIQTAYGETLMNASPNAIHLALFPEGNIDYGATFSLESSGLSLAAICVSEAYLSPKEEGSFLLVLTSGFAPRR